MFNKVGPSPDAWWGELKTSLDHGQTCSEGRRLPEGILGPVKNKPVLKQDGWLIYPSSTEDQGWRVHFEMTPDAGKSWKRVGPIDTAERYSVIQPSILKHGGDTLQILCRSRENQIVSSWSYDGGTEWSALAPVGLPNPNSGTDAVTLADGRQVLVYNPTKNDPGERGGPRSPLAVAVSTNGTDWQKVLTLEDKPGEYSYPAIIQDADGLIHITYTHQRTRIKYVKLDPSQLPAWG